MCAGNLALKFCNFANLAGLDPAEEEAIAIWEMETENSKMLVKMEPIYLMKLLSWVNAVYVAC